MEKKRVYHTAARSSVAQLLCQGQQPISIPTRLRRRHRRLRGGQGIKEGKSNLRAERVESSFCLVGHGGGSQVARKTIQKESETVSDPESRAIPCSHPAVRLCFRHHARPAACSRAKTKHFDSGYFAVKRDLLHWPPVFASDCCSLQHVLPARSFALRVRQEA